MRFHWFWPFARVEELEWARCTVRTGEQIVVQVVDREHAPPAGCDRGVRVIRDLADVDRTASGPGWLLSRTKTYTARSRARRNEWKSESFDLVHLHYTNRFTDSFARLPSPTVISVHDVLPHQLRLGPYLEHRLLSRLYGRPAALIVHHRNLADHLIRDFSVPAERIHVVPHQVFPVDGGPAPLPPGPPSLLFFGALRANKGLAVLKEAMALVADMEIRLVIAGRGDHAVERLALEMQATDARVTAEVGFVTLGRKYELFRQATAVVLPYTEFTSQSGVLHDAYGHGRPVIVSDVGALGDTVREDGTGLVIPATHPLELAMALRRVADSEMSRQLASAAAQIAQSRSPSVVGPLLRSVYDVVLG